MHFKHIYKKIRIKFKKSPKHFHIYLKLTILIYTNFVILNIYY